MALSKPMSLEESKQLAKIGYNIAHYRKLRNMTQDELAEKADIAKATLSSIESSTRFPNPSILVIIRLANALNIPVQFIFEFNQNID